MSNKDTDVVNGLSGEPEYFPRLRFAEFREAGPWKRAELNKYLDEFKQRNRDLKYGPEDVLSVSGEFGCVNQIEHLGRSYAGVTVKDYRVVECGDIVYTKSPLKMSPFGIIKENKGKAGIVSTLYAIYRVRDNAYPAYFDHYFSRSFSLNAYLQPLVKKGAKNDMKVNNGAVLSGPVIVPELHEQKRVSDCLSALDALIFSESKKLDSLKVHKNGLLQKLFPRDDQALPSAQFPEFRQKNNWVRRKLSEFLFEHGKKSTGKEEVYSVSVSKGLVNQIEHLGRSYAAASTSHYNLVCPGDIVYTKSPTGSFPLGIIKQSKIDIPVIVSPLYGVFTPESAALGRVLDAYFASSANTNNYLAPIVQKGAKNTINITNNTFLSKELCLPCDPAEQQKIADLLACVEGLIGGYARKIELLKQHKIGLMQRLFPEPIGLHA